MIKNKMTLNVSARELKKIEFDEAIFDETINEILVYIEDHIRRAHSDKKNYVVVAIPYIFNISGISDHDARLVVYARVIQEVKDKGFKVRICIKNKTSDKKALLGITWKSYLDTKKLSELETIINAHTIDTKKKKTFLQD
jgi:hypothetical protein